MNQENKYSEIYTKDKQIKDTTEQEDLWIDFCQIKTYSQKESQSQSQSQDQTQYAHKLTRNKSIGGQQNAYPINSTWIGEKKMDQLRTFLTPQRYQGMAAGYTTLTEETDINEVPVTKKPNKQKRIKQIANKTKLQGETMKPTLFGNWKLHLLIITFFIVITNIHGEKVKLPKDAEYDTIKNTYEHMYVEYFDCTNPTNIQLYQTNEVGDCNVVEDEVEETPVVIQIYHKERAAIVHGFVCMLEFERHRTYCRNTNFYDSQFQAFDQMSMAQYYPFTTEQCKTLATPNFNTTTDSFITLNNIDSNKQSMTVRFKLGETYGQNYEYDKVKSGNHNTGKTKCTSSGWKNDYLFQATLLRTKLIYNPRSYKI